MNVHFEWYSGDDKGAWEVVAKTERHLLPKWLRRISWWGWVILAVVLAGSLAGGYFFLRSRYDRAVREATFQIQGVIDIEALAFARRDRDLFLDQQDAEAGAWYAEQQQRSDPNCEWMAYAEGSLYNPCAQVLPAEIQDLELRGNMAWVEVIEEENSLRKVLFYRRTGQGWKHTAPQVEFWQGAVELQYGDLVFRYHQRDEPYMDPLIERIYQTARDVCTTLQCPFQAPLEMNFAAEVPLSQLPKIQPNELVLASPWLTGIREDGTQDEAYLSDLTYWVAYTVASRATVDAGGQDLGLLQRIILDEYATWYTRGDVTRAPLLGRALKLHGEQALPEVLRSLGRTSDLSWFTRRWLSARSVSEREGRGSDGSLAIRTVSVSHEDRSRASVRVFTSTEAVPLTGGARRVSIYSGTMTTTIQSSGEQNPAQERH